MKHEFSVVIVSYRNKTVLDSCLDSIERFNDIAQSLQVIVVEQTEDDSIYLSLLESGRDITVVRADNRGFGAGNNIGFELVDSPYVLFLNPDTELTEPIFNYAISYFQSNPKVGLFGMKLIGSDGSAIFSFSDREPCGPVRYFAAKARNRFNLFSSTNMYIEGADMFVRSSAFRLCGRFDERMFMYWEESDLCNRLNDVGFNIGFIKEKKIIHLGGMSSGGSSTYPFFLDSLELLSKKTNSSYVRWLKRLNRFFVFQRIFGKIDNKSLSQQTLVKHRLVELTRD